MFLLDTNVISELRKGDKCDARVAAWYAGIPEADLFTSVIVAGELRRLPEVSRRRKTRRLVMAMNTARTLDSDGVPGTCRRSRGSQSGGEVGRRR